MLCLEIATWQLYRFKRVPKRVMACLPVSVKLMLWQLYGYSLVAGPHLTIDHNRRKAIRKRPRQSDFIAGQYYFFYFGSVVLYGFCADLSTIKYFAGEDSGYKPKGCCCKRFATSQVKRNLMARRLAVKVLINTVSTKT